MNCSQDSQRVFKPSRRKIPTLPDISLPNTPHKPLRSPTTIQTLKSHQQWLHKTPHHHHNQKPTPIFSPHKHQQLQTYTTQQLNIFYEYFMPNCDRKYFGILDMRMGEIVGRVFGNTGVKITWGNFRGLQRSLPQPKIFCNSFITKERHQLQEFRNTIRLKHGQPQTPKSSSKTLTTSPYLQAGNRVHTFCPLCHHIHPGTILSQYKDSYLINFIEPTLGAMKIPEFWVTGLSEKFCDQVNIVTSMGNNGEGNETMERGDCGRINLEAFAFYMSLVELKQQFLRGLKKIHENIQEQTQKKGQQLHMLSQHQLQQYGWIGSTLTLISIALRHLQSTHNLKPPPTQSHPPKKQKPVKPKQLPFLALSDLYSKIENTGSEDSGERKNWRRSSNDSADVEVQEEEQVEQEQEREGEERGQAEILEQVIGPFSHQKQ